MFSFCTVYRPQDAPIDFLENLSGAFVDSVLHDSNVIIIGDLNCILIGGDPEGHALSEFCSTFGLSHFIKPATRVTEKSKSLLDVALTTNENIVARGKPAGTTLSKSHVIWRKNHVRRNDC